MQYDANDQNTTYYIGSYFWNNLDQFEKYLVLKVSDQFHSYLESLKLIEGKIY